MSNASTEANGKTIFIDSTDINEVTPQDIIIMISKTDLEVVINRGKEELDQADSSKHTIYRVYKNNTDSNLQSAINAAQLSLENSNVTKEEIEKHIPLIETAIDNLEYDIMVNPDENPSSEIPDKDY